MEANLIPDKFHPQIQSAKRIMAITGAGISVASGMPTYRGENGLYTKKATEDGIEIEDALSAGMLRRNPALCWKYIYEIENSCRGSSPNRAHKILSEFEHELNIDTWIYTQNVDGLHTEAGSTQVIDIHADVHYLYCLKCDWNEFVVDYSNISIPPKCVLWNVTNFLSA